MIRLFAESSALLLLALGMAASLQIASDAMWCRWAGGSPTACALVQMEGKQ